MSNYFDDSESWSLDKVEQHMYILEGDLDPSCIDSCCMALRILPKGSVIRLIDLDIDDGPSLAVFITALRSIAPCTLLYAPKMLAHTIYKINAQDITLVHPRSY